MACVLNVQKNMDKAAERLWIALRHHPITSEPHRKCISPVVHFQINIFSKSFYYFELILNMHLNDLQGKQLVISRTEVCGFLIVHALFIFWVAQVNVTGLKSMINVFTDPV